MRIKQSVRTQVPSTKGIDSLLAPVASFPKGSWRFIGHSGERHERSGFCSLDWVNQLAVK